MKKHFYQNIKHILVPALCAAMTLSLAACGAQQEEQAAANEENKEYVYVPEYIALEKENENTYFNNLKIKGNYLYYSVDTYDEETETSQTSICKQSLEDGSKETLSLPTPENAYLNNYSFDEAGNIYAVYSDYSQEKVSEEGYSIPDMILRKFDTAGSQVFEKNITDTISKEVSDAYVQNMITDSEGKIYVCTENIVFLFDENGEAQGNVGISEGWINNMALGKDGKVYFCYYDYSANSDGTVLSEIDFQNKKIANTYSNIPGSNGNGFAPGTEKDFMINDGSKVYEYDMETQTYEELFAWLDCDINGDYVDYFGVLEDGTIVAVIRDWNTNETEIAKLVKKNASEVVQKEEIVVGTLYDSQELQSAAVEFNKTNEKYHVSIKTYIDNNNWTENTYSDAITSLQNDIMSGTNCPDIIEMSQINETKLAAKGLFEDLNPYLEQSTVLNREDFIETILDAYSYDGKLLSIPSTFNIETVVGKTSVVGDAMGWSLEEMMDCAAQYPDAVLFDGMQKSSILYYCMMYNQDTFVDWEKGECSFDSDAFKQVMEFANLFPDEIDWENYDGSDTIENLQNNRILLQNVSVYDLQEIQVYEAQFGEPVTFIGFPTSDGSVGCRLYASSRYGIVSKSEKKEGAWEFIESYLTTGTDSIFSWGLPTLKAELEEYITEATTPEYILDENGDPLLDENGEPMTAESSSMSSDGWSYTYHTPTEEDAEILRELIAEVKPMQTLDTELMTILTEEAEPFFQGQKSLDEVVGIIQSRAQIYISENS